MLNNASSFCPYNSEWSRPTHCAAMHRCNHARLVATTRRFAYTGAQRSRTTLAVPNPNPNPAVGAQKRLRPTATNQRGHFCHHIINLYYTDRRPSGQLDGKYLCWPRDPESC